MGVALEDHDVTPVPIHLPPPCSLPLSPPFPAHTVLHITLLHTCCLLWMEIFMTVDFMLTTERTIPPLAWTSLRRSPAGELDERWAEGAGT